MASTTNISINSRSMNGIITISDGTATLEDGNLNTTGLINAGTIDATNMDTTNMTLQNLTMTGSLNLPAQNDIVTSYGNVSFQNLGNSYLSNNVYLNGYLLPYFPLSTTSYRLGLNAMQYLNSASINNIAIGENSLSGKPGVVNQVTKSIAIGNSSFSSSPYGTFFNCSNNVSIGDNAQKYNYYNCQDSVCIGGQVASSIDIAGVSNSVVVGANIGKTALSGYNSAVVIGSNVLPSSGANSSVIIGPSAFSNSTFSYANGICVVGYNAGQNVIQNNRLTIFGNESLKYLNTNAFNMAIGPECANSLVNNTYCMCFGLFSDCANNLKNSTAFGVSCMVNESHTFKVGGNDGGLGGLGYTRHQDLLIPNKNRLLCGFFDTNATTTLSFEQGEYYFLNGTNPTVINLPTPASASTGSQNISNFGSRFTIVRTNPAVTQNITINPPSGQFIYFNGVASSSYSFSSAESYVSFVCCNNGAGTSTWAVERSQQVATGGFATGLSTNTINPYITANQCDLWVGSTASIINIGNQSTAQIINFSKINTNSIEPKAVGSDINLFTTTIATFLKLGNSGNIINANFYLNPTIAGTSTHTLTSTFNGGITATASQTINFGTNAPYMRGDNIVASSIGQTQIDNGYMDLWTNQQTTGGVKTFSNPPVMSGASITANSIPNSALQTTVTLDTTASTFSAVKTFSVAPVMSGASITATSIPNTALQTTVTLDTTASTFSALKTFTGGLTASATQTINFGSNAPTMSGSGISSGTIGQTQLSNGYVDLNSAQTISGIKSYNSAPNLGVQTLTTVPTSTISLSGGREVLLSASGITAVILPTPTSANIGQTFNIIRNGITLGNSYVIGPALGTDRILVDGVAQANYQTSFSQASLCVTCIATSGNVWVLNNYTNVNGLMLSKYFYPLQSGGGLPSNSNYALITSITMGNNACNSMNASNFHTQGNIVIGASALSTETLIPNSMTIIGNNALKLCTTNITNCTALGSNAGSAYANIGQNNTFLGANTDLTSSAGYANSTAVGYGSLISANNVVVLGRTSETVIIPSATLQYGDSYRPNNVYQTMTGAENWDTTPRSPLPKYIMYSMAGVATTTFTLPQISSTSVFEGMEFIFRRTNTTSGATTTSILQVSRGGTTDTIYINGAMTTSTSAVALASGAYYGKIVCINKTNTPYNWAYFPS